MNKKEHNMIKQVIIINFLIKGLIEDCLQMEDFQKAYNFYRSIFKKIESNDISK